MGELGLPPLPGLEVERGPDHVEEGEQHEPEVVQELALALEEDLKKGHWVTPTPPPMSSDK